MANKPYLSAKSFVKDYLVPLAEKHKANPESFELDVQDIIKHVSDPFQVRVENRYFDTMTHIETVYKFYWSDTIVEVKNNGMSIEISATHHGEFYFSRHETYSNNEEVINQ